MTYTCDPCEGANPVTVLMTSLRDGTTDASCAQDMPIMLLGQLALWAEVDPNRLYEHVRKFIDKEHAAAAKAAEDQAARPVPIHQPCGTSHSSEDQCPATASQDEVGSVNGTDLETVQ